MNRKTILIVDDDKFTRHVYKLYFERNGYAVREAMNGKEAITMADEDASVSVVLLDLLMPTYDGFAFLQHFSSRARANSTELKVILITSMDPEDYQNNVSVMHIDTSKICGFFNKPVDLHELCTLVSGLGNASPMPL